MDIVYLKGKGKGKSRQQRRNPIGSDGSPMKCSTGGPEYHLRRWCPRGKGKGKRGKDKGPSGGLPS
eukprot:7068944-Prorocentrum_lima.AAC.1